MGEIMSEQTVIASKGGYEPHPDSYSPRVFVYVRATEIYYELLRTGEAVPWVTLSPKGFDFWIIDCPKLEDVGVHRETVRSIEPHVIHDVEVSNA
jgi:hypothetical protein